jgi:hypothetical protein
LNDPVSETGERGSSRKMLYAKDLSASPKGALFKTATSAALHDAVMNTATIWKLCQFALLNNYLIKSPHIAFKG